VGGEGDVNGEARTSVGRVSLARPGRAAPPLPEGHLMQLFGDSLWLDGRLTDQMWPQHLHRRVDQSRARVATAHAHQPLVGLYLHQGVDVVHGLDLVRPAPDGRLAQERDGANLYDFHVGPPRGWCAQHRIVEGEEAVKVEARASVLTHT